MKVNENNLPCEFLSFTEHKRWYFEECR